LGLNYKTIILNNIYKTIKNKEIIKILEHCKKINISFILRFIIKNYNKFEQLIQLSKKNIIIKNNYTKFLYLCVCFYEALKTNFTKYKAEILCMLEKEITTNPYTTKDEILEKILKMLNQQYILLD